MAERAEVIVVGMGPGTEDVAGKLAEAGLDVVGIDGELVGGECPYWGCIPSKMMIRAANLLTEARRIPGMAGDATVRPDWTPVAARIRGLTKKYGDFVAVDGIDFDIQHGEIFALLGPNGAGKTTVVEILEGHRRRDAGDVEVLGVDPATAPRRWYDRIGIVLQRSGDAPDLTPRELLRHYSSYYSKGREADEIDDRVHADLAQDVSAVGLDGLRADAEHARDAAVAVAAHQELEHVALAP